MRIHITGSKVHRVWMCPPSAILPQIDTSEPSPAADRGKAIHAFLERCRIIGLEAALGECTDEELLPLLKAIDLDALPTHLATEVSLAYDWHKRTARELGRNLGRGYTTPGFLTSIGVAELGPTEIPCTVDLLGVNVVGGVRRAYVGDYKTGHTKLPPPDRFGQTLLGGLAAAVVYDAEEVVLELVHIHSDGTHHTVRRKVDRWELETFADELEAALEGVGYAEAEYAAGRGVSCREGPHCDFCPAYQQCPAKIALVRAIPESLESIGVVREAESGGLMVAPGAITVANAAHVWMVLERISEVIGRAKDEICGLGAFADIPLPDGRVIGRLVTEREGLDGKIAAGVLEQWYGREAAEEAIEISMSKDALRRAVTKRKKDKEKISTRAGDGVFDRILTEIRTRGGTERTRTESVKPHVPRKRLKSAGE